MLDRLDYSLTDFLLFSPRAYDRMFELHNRALWPLQVVAMAVAGYLLFVTLRPSPLRVRIAFGLLALIWLFVTWSFFLGRYATINWAAMYVAPAFALQAVLLGVVAFRSRAPDGAPRATFDRGLAFVVLLFSLIGYPLIAVAVGKSWLAAEIFAIAPDPTATATLAFLTLSRRLPDPALVLIPVLWIIATALTLWALGSSEFFVAPLVALLCAAAVLSRRQ